LFFIVDTLGRDSINIHAVFVNKNTLSLSVRKPLGQWKRDALPMLNTLIVGASGYAGAELVTYVNRHPHMTITALTVSAQSNDAGKLISDLHPQLKGIVDLPLQPMSDISEFSAGVDVVFRHRARSEPRPGAAVPCRWLRGVRSLRRLPR
jgi:hypothetical protein